MSRRPFTPVALPVLLLLAAVGAAAIVAALPFTILGIACTHISGALLGVVYWISKKWEGWKRG